VGRVGQVRLLITQRVKEAHRPPHGKRAPVTEINHFQRQQRFEKTAKLTHYKEKFGK
jgi:hypothetical protein